MKINHEYLYALATTGEEDWNRIEQTAMGLGMTLDALKLDVLKGMGLDPDTLATQALEDNMAAIQARALEVTLEVAGVEMNLQEANDWLIFSAAARQAICDRNRQFVSDMAAEFGITTGLQWVHRPEGHGIEPLTATVKSSGRTATNPPGIPWLNGTMTTWAALAVAHNVPIEKTSKNGKTYKMNPAREIVNTKNAALVKDFPWKSLEIHYAGDCPDYAPRFAKHGTALVKTAVPTIETPEEPAVKA